MSSKRPASARTTIQAARSAAAATENAAHDARHLKMGRYYPNRFSWIEIHAMFKLILACVEIRNIVTRLTWLLNMLLPEWLDEFGHNVIFLVFCTRKAIIILTHGIKYTAMIRIVPVEAQ